MRLFAYGTLMLPAVIESVIGRRPEGAAAVLSGFARYRILGEVFPGLVACEGGMTDGVLYDGIGRSDLELTDRFEGAWYERTVVKVSRAGARADACVYVVRPEYRDILSTEPWDLEWFARHRRDRTAPSWSASAPGRDQRKRDSGRNRADLVTGRMTGSATALARH